MAVSEVKAHSCGWFFTPEWDRKVLLTRDIGSTGLATKHRQHKVWNSKCASKDDTSGLPSFSTRRKVQPSAPSATTSGNSFFQETMLAVLNRWLHWVAFGTMTFKRFVNESLTKKRKKKTSENIQYSWKVFILKHVKESWHQKKTFRRLFCSVVLT